jgi:potassium/chloride transporter 4/5/6
MSRILEIFKFSKKEEGKGLGTFMGVFVPSLLMLFGVIIFLRLGWIVGNVGLTATIILVLISTLIAMTTLLSMAAIATNIEVGKGGIYYIISRSLGLEVGSSLGIPLYLKQALSISFCVVGFAESLNDLIPSWSITTIGIYTLIFTTLFASVSLKGALKVQITIFVILIGSLVSLFTGGNLVPMHPDTFTPEPLKHFGFWAFFAIFFPAMTGLESSVSLSGDLKNPSKSLPLGTISALLVAAAVYILIPIFLVKHVSLERLAYDPLIIQDVASVPSLIVVGIWGATLSSALGGLLGAPRTLQAISDDGVLPAFLGKTYGKNNEPRIATMVTFVISFLGVYFGSINIIAPMLTMICLICYGVLNLAAGLETLMDNPSWRPRFPVHWSISIAGWLLCFAAMFMINPGAAIISLFFVLAIYLILKRGQYQGSWDDIRHGIFTYFSRLAIYRLAYAHNSHKSWRPHFLVFIANTSQNATNLMNFSQAMSRSKGFLTMATILPHPRTTELEKMEREKEIAQNLFKQNIEALVQINFSDNITDAMKQMILHYGLGPLSPNTVVFGGIPKTADTADFAQVIKSTFDRHCNIVIVNYKERLSSLEPANSKGDIHIWWDDNNRCNSEFMLVLSLMLKKSPMWRRAKICVKAVVADESLREKELVQFRELAQKQRLKLEIEVLIAGNSQQDQIDLIKTHSKDAGIVFVSLLGPEMEDYPSYLRSLPTSNTELPPIAMVLSSEHTPLENILS